MSIEILKALAGESVVLTMSADDQKKLCEAIDAEILSDEHLVSRLLEALKPHLPN